MDIDDLASRIFSEYGDQDAYAADPAGDIAAMIRDAIADAVPRWIPVVEYRPTRASDAITYTRGGTTDAPAEYGAEIDGVYRSGFLVSITSFVNAEGKAIPDMPDRCEVQYTDDSGAKVTKRVKSVDAGNRTLRIVTDTNEP